MNNEPIHIGIADGHNLVRKALKNWLCQFLFFDVKIDADNRKDLFDRLYGDSRVDVLLFDLVIPWADVKDCLLHLREKYPYIRILIMSMSLDYPQINELMDMGVCGCLLKEADLSELAEAIQEVYKGRIHRNKVLTEALYWKTNFTMQNHTPSNQPFFTETQKKILQLLWDEKGTNEIAREVFLSVSAVDKIKQQLKDMTGAKSTVGLIRYAIENRIIRL